jgi:hypothetical protein
VRLDARIASPNLIHSPLSGHAAALIGWRFFVRYHIESQRNNYRTEHYDLLWSTILGSDVLLDAGGRTVLVPNQLLTLTSAIDLGHGVPVEGPLPPNAAHVLALPLAQRGLVFYSELLLRTGDAVRLWATVEARDRAGQSAYRSSGERGADFVARPDLGEMILQDRSVA